MIHNDTPFKVQIRKHIHFRRILTFFLLLQTLDQFLDKKGIFLSQFAMSSLCHSRENQPECHLHSIYLTEVRTTVSISGANTCIVCKRFFKRVLDQHCIEYISRNTVQIQQRVPSKPAFHLKTSSKAIIVALGERERERIFQSKVTSLAFPTCFHGIYPMP